MADRLADTVRFYQLLDQLARRVGRPRLLRDCNGRMGWPQRGVYFFFETGEARSYSGTGPRVVRVGTHAVRGRSGAKLWDRLIQHKGTQSGSGSQRASVFRELLGIAIAERESIPLPTFWRINSDPSKAARKLGLTRKSLLEGEAGLEARVSTYIGQMPFLWVNVDDAPAPSSERSFIERNSIALLSGYASKAADQPSSGWLGRWSDRERVRGSGLWNNDHVDEAYAPSFLDALERRIVSTHPP